MAFESEALNVVLEVIDTFEDLGLPYHVGGSFASSIHAVPRQTLDLDMKVDLAPAAVAPLVARLEGRFFVDPDMIRRAIAKPSSFHLIHFGTGFKVDVFVLGERPFDQMEFQRRVPQPIDDASDRKVMVKSAEDTVSRELEWYRLGGESSDRQWTDILGILRHQGDRLELEYLRHWAVVLGVADLLRRALGER